MASPQKPPKCPSNGDRRLSNGSVNAKTMVHAPDFVRMNSQPYAGGYETNGNTAVDGNGSSNGTNGSKGPVTMSPVNSTADFQHYHAPTYRPLINRIRDRIERNEQFFSLEFFPPKTLNGLANFLTRLDRLSEGGPLFVDVTWHMGSDPGSDKETSSSSVASACLNYCLVDTMLHITCAQYTKEQTLKHLQRAKDLGMRNIMALRGDLAPSGDGIPNYKYKAVDLVQWIREEYGDYFTIAVAGYPSGHPDAASYADDLENLKAKCDAGADMIVTQLFFDTDVFIKFVHDCREIGIKVPIIPGIMPIQSYDNIRRIAQLSRLTIPKFVLDAIEPIQANDEAVRNYGVWLSVQQCKKLLDLGLVPSVHIYTLNRERAAREILQQIGLWRKQSPKYLPWKPPSDHPQRCKEDVRPIFWSSRPKSYIYRTKDWDDFPNGRWGNSSSPAFGNLSEYYLFSSGHVQPKEQLMKMWGEPQTEQDVWKVFEDYVAHRENEQGAKVSRLPWSEVDLAAETVLLKEQLLWCNSNGIMTINSQPNVNGAPSTDPLVGWGKPGGYCYQKAYLEFFISRRHRDSLLSALKRYPQVQYHIIDRMGDGLTNSDTNDPNAVTWGVFPGQEIAQPTVVDPLSFHAWRDEAYDLWLSQWAALYPEDSASHQTIKRMHDDCLLVNLVDNDFPQPCCLWPLLAEMLADPDQTATAESTVSA